MAKCYNCGNEFPRKKLTGEHIPPSCFSDVYSEEFKRNRITVLCCEPCNNDYSKIDNELRDMIAILKDGQDGNTEFLEKGVKSIMNRKDIGKGFVYDKRVGQYKIDFDYDPMQKLFEKCHKGMFYEKYGFPIGEMFVSQPIQKMINEKHNTKLNEIFENFHKQRPESFMISGHPDIFKASILAYKRGHNETFDITEDLEDCIAVSSYMVFHNQIDCLVAGVRKDSEFHEMIKPALDNE